MNPELQTLQKLTKEQALSKGSNPAEVLAKLEGRLVLEAPESLENTNPDEFLNDEVLDRIWYGKLESVIGEPVYEYFEDTHESREEEKNKFLAGEVRNPNLEYPRLDLDELYFQQEKLRNLKADVIENEDNLAVREAYRWKLNSEIMANRLLIAASTGDMEMFKLLNEYVYGAPSKDIFTHTVNELRNELTNIKDVADENLLEAISKLEEVLPDNLGEPSIIHIPTQGEVDLVQSVTNFELGDLINIDDPKGLYKDTDIQTEFELALEKLGLENWDVIIDRNTSRANLSVNQKAGAVYIPEGRELLHDNMRSLIAHEIGTHVVRRENGKRSKLMLLGLGLDKYEKGEEGIATMREQAINGTANSTERADGHLAISLAYGLDGQPRDFREVYETMNALYYYQSIKNGTPKNLATEQAKNQAWMRTLRAFRGTDAKTPGTVFTKDIVYAEGNYDVWNVVKNNPEELLRFSVGKYDPANPRHIWIMDQVGISEQDLEIYKNRD